MLDLIDRVGPGGHFIATRETAQRCREEIWMPRLMNRDPWEAWDSGGRPRMLDRVRQRLRSILAAHESPPLPAGVEKKIEAIIQAAEEREAAESRR